MSHSLLATRRFAGLFWCQFFSALNDNFLKNALVFLILFRLGAEAAGPLVSLAAATLMAPFFFLSALGGEIADRWDKAIVARRLKLVEIPVAGLAILGFVLHSIPVLFAALLGFGILAALFGPVKYGILPDQLDKGELPAGNALIETATFLAILLGTVIGGSPPSSPPSPFRRPDAASPICRFAPTSSPRPSISCAISAATGACSGPASPPVGSGRWARWRWRFCRPSSRARSAASTNW